MSVVEAIQRFAQNDPQLALLIERVQEYAELYLIAKKRQKGCDGMGEVATLEDEFIYSMNEAIRQCREKGYLSEDVSYEIDSTARAVCKMHME
ncbi:MAG: hypothetical protein AB1442_03810 [Nitrospirota bacterium]